MKICVYAICKNEEKFVERWINSVKEADKIYVLDTGSTDNTISLLKKYDVKLFQKEIKPWRFDSARNYILSKIPDYFDLFICLDLDELLISNWRKIIEDNYIKGTTRIRYTYNWSLDESNKPLVSFYGEKIHVKKNYKWIYPVHEILVSDNEEKVQYIDSLTINHYPDKSKSRKSYLKLLEKSVKEYPNSDRNVHYLGREYMYNRKWNKSIDTLINHLNMDTAVWKDERAASMRFISKDYIMLKRYDEAYLWINKAIKEAPYLREPLVEKAFLEYSFKNYKNVIKLCNSALKIKYHNKTYINEVYCYDETIYDLLSVSYYNENKYYSALKNVNKALRITRNKRLINNKKIIKEKLNN